MSEVNFRIGHLDHLESPWGNAGGVVKSVEDVEAMAKTGVGWIEAGSYTLERRFGNQRNSETGNLIFDPEIGAPIKVYHYDNKTGETTNSLGMPNKGMDKVEDEIPEMVRIAEAYDKKLIVNVAPVSDDPVKETQELVWRGFEAGAHAILVNGGCPNVKTKEGERHEILSLNSEITELVLAGLSDVVARYYKVFFRLSPQGGILPARRLYKAIERSDTVSAGWIPNSWPDLKPTYKVDGEEVAILGVRGGTGGRTGPATAGQAQAQTYWAIESLRGSGIGVVRSGGIMDFESDGLKVDAAQELKNALKIGAVAAAGSTFYFEPVNSWEEDTHKLLDRFSGLRPA